jgi:hypothetical protein
VSSFTPVDASLSIWNLSFLNELEGMNPKPLLEHLSSCKFCTHKTEKKYRRNPYVLVEDGNVDSSTGFDSRALKLGYFNSKAVHSRSFLHSRT